MKKPTTGFKSLDEIYRYHAPTPTQIDTYAQLREGAKAYAQIIANLVPECAYKERALQDLHLVNMMANAAIAITGED